MEVSPHNVYIVSHVEPMESRLTRTRHELHRRACLTSKTLNISEKKAANTPPLSQALLGAGAGQSEAAGLSESPAWGSWGGRQARPRPAPCESYRLWAEGRAPLASQPGMNVTSGQNSDAGVPGEQGSNSPRDTGLL